MRLQVFDLILYVLTPVVYKELLEFIIAETFVVVYFQDQLPGRPVGRCLIPEVKKGNSQLKAK